MSVEIIGMVSSIIILSFKFSCLFDVLISLFLLKFLILWSLRDLWHSGTKYITIYCYHYNISSFWNTAILRKPSISRDVDLLQSSQDEKPFPESRMGRMDGCWYFLGSLVCQAKKGQSQVTSSYIYIYKLHISYIKLSIWYQTSKTKYRSFGHHTDPPSFGSTERDKSGSVRPQKGPAKGQTNLCNNGCAGTRVGAPNLRFHWEAGCWWVGWRSSWLLIGWVGFQKKMNENQFLMKGLGYKFCPKLRNFWCNQAVSCLINPWISQRWVSKQWVWNVHHLKLFILGPSRLSFRGARRHPASVEHTAHVVAMLELCSAQFLENLEMHRKGQLHNISPWVQLMAKGQHARYANETLRPILY